MKNLRLDVSGELFSAHRNAFAIDARVGSQYYFKAEATMIITTGDGDRHIEPETATTLDLEAVTALNERLVEAIDVVEDGSLIVHFATGERITLLPSTNSYEAWTFHSPEGLFIGMPGGGLG